MPEQEVTFEQLAAYASGELSGAEAARIEAWLAPEAARNVGLLREVIETLRSDDTEPATPSAIRRAVAALAAERSGWLSAARQLLAELIHDSRWQLAPGGYRGGPAGAGYQLSYDSSWGRVDVQVLPPSPPSSRGYRVRGQVNAVAGAAAGDVVLRQRGGDAVLASGTDDFGRFKIEADPGAYDLLIELDGGARTIVAPGLEIGPES